MAGGVGKLVCSLLFSRHHEHHGRFPGTHFEQPVETSGCRHSGMDIQSLCLPHVWSRPVRWSDFRHLRTEILDHFGEHACCA